MSKSINKLSHYLYLTQCTNFFWIRVLELTFVHYLGVKISAEMNHIVLANKIKSNVDKIYSIVNVKANS